MHPSEQYLSRRRIIAGAASLLGSVALSATAFAPARAGRFPTRNIDVYVTDSERSGTARLLHIVTDVWKNYLKANFRSSFYPGAAGRVGYETYMSKAPADCHSLLFGNMGTDTLQRAIGKPTFQPDDFFYFVRIDADPYVVFVGAQSPFATIDDIVAAGKKRTLTVGTPQMADPATLGILAVGAHTGASFKPVSISGIQNVITGVIDRKVDLGVLPSTPVAEHGFEILRTLLVFDDRNRLGARLSSLGEQAPAANDRLGMTLPPLLSAHAFGIKRRAAETYPDRLKILNDSLKKVFGDLGYKSTINKTWAPWEYIRYGDRDGCRAYVESIAALGERFKASLATKHR